jgi:hypothetical protein
MVVGSVLESPLPPDTEARVAQLTELLATATANAERRAGLARLAEEQAGSRRVATGSRDLPTNKRRCAASPPWVASGTAPEEGFDAVLDEVCHLLPVQSAGTGRYESDESLTVVAAWGEARSPFRAGSRHLKLRELAHGILPAALTCGGLPAGIEALVSRVSLSAWTCPSIAWQPAWRQRHILSSVKR